VLDEIDDEVEEESIPNKSRKNSITMNVASRPVLGMSGIMRAAGGFIITVRPCDLCERRHNRHGDLTRTSEKAPQIHSGTLCVLACLGWRDSIFNPWSMFHADDHATLSKRTRFAPGQEHRT
jgi:hypothetical protein